MLSLRDRLWVCLTVSQTTLCNSPVRSLLNFCCWRPGRTFCSLCLNLYHTSVCEITNCERPCLTCAVLLDAVHRPHDTERKTTFSLHLPIMAVKRLCASLISSEKHFMAMIYRCGFRIYWFRYITSINSGAARFAWSLWLRASHWLSETVSGTRSDLNSSGTCRSCARDL